MIGEFLSSQEDVGARNVVVGVRGKEICRPEARERHAAAGAKQC